MYNMQDAHEKVKPFIVELHKSLFTYNRLPLGVFLAPAVFQRTMENLLQGIPMVVVYYLDDILVRMSRHT